MFKLIIKLLLFTFICNSVSAKIVFRTSIKQEALNELSYLKRSNTRTKYKLKRLKVRSSIYKVQLNYKTIAQFSTKEELTSFYDSLSISKQKKVNVIRRKGKYTYLIDAKKKKKRRKKRKKVKKVIEEVEEEEEAVEEEQEESTEPEEESDWSYSIAPRFDGQIYQEKTKGNESWFGLKLSSAYESGPYLMSFKYDFSYGTELNNNIKIEKFDGTKLEYFFEGGSALKVGFLSFLWGKMDESSTFYDHIRQDLSRFTTTDLAQRSINYPSAYIETSFGDISLELFTSYNNKSNIFAAPTSKWSLINYSDGSVFNFDLDPQFQPLVPTAGMFIEESVSFDYGIKSSFTFGNLDLSLLYLSYLRPMPYMHLNPDFAQGLLSGQTIPALLFQYNSTLFWQSRETINKMGLDLSYSSGASIFKMEASYSTGNYITQTNLLTTTSAKIEYGASWEKDYIDGKLKHVLQVNGFSFLEDESTFLDQASNNILSTSVKYIVKDEVVDLDFRYTYDLATESTIMKIGSYYQPELSTKLKLEYFKYSGSTDKKGFAFFNENSSILLGLEGTY